MNNGFENDNVNENAQPNNENGNINSDTNETGPAAGADSMPAQPSNGAGRPRSGVANPAPQDQNDEPADKQKEKFSFKNFKISDIIAQIKKFWTDMPPKRKKIVIAAAVGVVVLAVLLAVIINSTRNPMVTIYSGLDRTEAMGMAGLLEQLNIPAKVDTSRGVVVLNVREKQQYAAVRELSNLGYPKKAGLMYTETTTASGLFPTDAEIEAAEIKSRENKIAAIIGSYEGIEYAEVIITPASNSNKIIVKNSTPTKATATLYLKPGVTLSYESVMGIETLLLNGVAGLERANISINDGSGVQLNVGENQTTKFNTLSEFKMDYEQKAKNLLEAQLTDLCQRVFGIDNIWFMVTLQYDFDPMIRESTKYNGANINPDTEEEKGILSSEEWERNIFSGTDSTVQGAAGTDLNMDDPNYYELSDQAAEGDFGDNYHRYNQYLVDSVQEQTSKETPVVSSCTVAVFLNMAELDSDVEDKLINTVAMATPVREIATRNATEDTIIDVEAFRSYISIFAAEFPGEDTQQAAEPTFNLLEWLLENFSVTQLLIGTGILLLFIIIIIMIIIIVRRMSKKDALMAAAAEEGGFAMIDSEGKPVVVDDFSKAVGKYASDEAIPPPIKPNENKEQLLKKQIKMFTDQNPDITAQLIRTLIKGDEPSNG